MTRPFCILTLCGLAACTPPALPGAHPLPLRFGRVLELGKQPPAAPDSAFRVTEHVRLDHPCLPSDTTYFRLTYLLTDSTGPIRALVQVSPSQVVTSYVLYYPQEATFGALLERYERALGPSLYPYGYIWVAGDAALQLQYNGSQALHPVTARVFPRSYYEKCLKRTA